MWRARLLPDKAVHMFHRVFVVLAADFLAVKCDKLRPKLFDRLNTREKYQKNGDISSVTGRNQSEVLTLRNSLTHDFSKTSG